MSVLWEFFFFPFNLLTGQTSICDRSADVRDSLFTKVFGTVFAIRNDSLQGKELELEGKGLTQVKLHCLLQMRCDELLSIGLWGLKAIQLLGPVVRAR